MSASTVSSLPSSSSSPAPAPLFPFPNSECASHGNVADNSSGGGVSASKEEISQTNGKPKMCTIGVQTEVHPIDHSLPLWALSQVYIPEPVPTTVRRTAQQASPSKRVKEKPFTKPFPLYTDVLQVILRYLTNNDLLIAMQLSKQWLQSFTTANLRLSSAAGAYSIARMPPNSAFARQVAQAADLGPAILQSVGLVHPGFSLLNHLAMLFPNLTSLYIPNHTNANSFFLPPSLQSLTVSLSNHADYQPLAKAIQSSEKLTDLHFLFDANQLESSTFLAFIPLSRVETLHVSCPNYSYHYYDKKYGDSLAEFVRQCRLKKLNLAFDVGSPRLASMLHQSYPGHTFPLMQSGNLTSLNLGNTTLDRSLLQALTNYPSLTHLTPLHIDLDAVDMKLMLKLRGVDTLVVSKSQSQTRTTTDAIVAACQNLPNLTRLQVIGWTFSTEQMEDCLACLPYLTSLDLTGCGARNKTFSSLIKYGLPQRLKFLSLQSFLVPARDLTDYILPLQQLEVLKLREVCECQVLDETEELIRQMPKMIKIRCVLDLVSPVAFQDSRRAATEAEELRRKKPRDSSNSSSSKRQHVETHSESGASSESQVGELPDQRGQKRAWKGLATQTTLSQSRVIEQSQEPQTRRRLAPSSSSSSSTIVSTPSQIAPPAQSAVTPFSFSSGLLGSGFTIGASSSPAKSTAKQVLAISPSSTQKSRIITKHTLPSLSGDDGGASGLMEGLSLQGGRPTPTSTVPPPTTFAGEEGLIPQSQQNTSFNSGAEVSDRTNLFATSPSKNKPVSSPFSFQPAAAIRNPFSKNSFHTTVSSTSSISGVHIFGGGAAAAAAAAAATAIPVSTPFGAAAAVQLPVGLSALTEIALQSDQTSPGFEQSTLSQHKA